MRILHTSDWHINGSQSLPDFLYRQEEAIYEVFRIARKYEVNVLLMAGDVFDHHIISEEARKLFFRILADGSKEEFSSVYVNGNHDIYKEEGSIVSLFQDVSTAFMPNTHIVDMKPKLVEIEDLSVMAIPFSESLNSQTFKTLVKQGREESQGKYYVPMAHFMIKGAIRDNGTISPDGLELPKPTWSYCCLGDVHTFQKMGENAYYSGAPIQHKFGDSLPKGVVIVDLKQGKRKFVEIKKPTIKTLIQLKKVPKEWPNNAWVDFKSSEPIENLPDAVLKNSTNIEKEDISKDIQLDDVTLGLPEFAANRGMKAKAQKRLVKMVKVYHKRIKNKILED